MEMAAMRGNIGGAKSHSERQDETLHFGQRLHDVDARLAALKIRVDNHDSRLSGMYERVEDKCHQAIGDAREVAAQHREEILAEVECQLKLLGKRIEAIGDLCEELSLREMCKSSKWPLGPQGGAGTGV